MSNQDLPTAILVFLYLFIMVMLGYIMGSRLGSRSSETEKIMLKCDKGNIVFVCDVETN